MDEILEILAEDARRTPEEIAKLTGRDVNTVKKAIKEFEKNGVIVKYKAIVNHELLSETSTCVRAIIEVSIHPQKDAGFDQVAERIYNFPEVKSCYLMSGAYDLLVEVEGENIQTVANFIASKLATLEHVSKTATHFLLKKYKEDGQILKKAHQRKRLAISY